MRHRPEQYTASRRRWIRCQMTTPHTGHCTIALARSALATSAGVLPGWNATAKARITNAWICRVRAALRRAR